MGVAARLFRRSHAPFSAKFASTEAKKACQDDATPQVAPYKGLPQFWSKKQRSVVTICHYMD
jgi:hypothetical protein